MIYKENQMMSSESGKRRFKPIWDCSSEGRSEQTVAADLEREWRDELRATPADDLAKEIDLFRVLLVAKRDACPSEPALNIEDVPQLTLAILRGANLSGADLGSANLIEANLTEANLTSANLIDAKLSRATLSGTDFTKADIAGTDFRNADLSNVKGMTLQQLSSAKVNENTTVTKFIKAIPSGGPTAPWIFVVCVASFSLIRLGSEWARVMEWVLGLVGCIPTRAIPDRAQLRHRRWVGDRGLADLRIRNMPFQRRSPDFLPADDNRDRGGDRH